MPYLRPQEWIVGLSKTWFSVEAPGLRTKAIDDRSWTRLQKKKGPMKYPSEEPLRGVDLFVLWKSEGPSLELLDGVGPHSRMRDNCLSY